MGLIRDVQDKKRVFGKANCFDFERIFFELDKNRKGYFEKEDLKEYLEKNSYLFKISDQDIGMLFTFFDRKEEGQIRLDDVILLSIFIESSYITFISSTNLLKLNI